MLQVRMYALGALILGGVLGWWVYSTQTNQTHPFKLGLDLSGGTHLVFTADLSRVNSTDVEDSMESLRDTIERRVNLFGVSEPLVYREKGSAIAGNTDERLVVELPGVTNSEEAVRMIGQTPVLEFRLQPENSTSTNPADFVATSLTGRYLSRAQLEFGQNGGLSNEPIVSLVFDSEGADLFESITRENTGRLLGIFLDGAPISVPIINEPISGGRAIISGGFTPDEARLLVRNLNFGALPVPIELSSTQTIGSSLGAQAVQDGVVAGIFGLLVVALFMVLWYRLPGVIAVISLAVYLAVVLAAFKAIPVVLTAAGIAGLILSLGMAVDANVIIFERIKEEFKDGRGTEEGVREGFKRAWPAIRDGNITSLITAVILFWFGSSLIKGFALVFSIGILSSMFSAIMVSRAFLLSLSLDRRNRFVRFIFGSGIRI